MLRLDTMGAEGLLVEVLGIKLDFGDLVVVTFHDGQVLKGVFCDYDPSDETVSGFDEIEVREAISYALRVDEISKIEKVA